MIIISIILITNHQKCDVHSFESHAPPAFWSIMIIFDVSNYTFLSVSLSVSFSPIWSSETSSPDRTTWKYHDDNDHNACYFLQILSLPPVDSSSSSTIIHSANCGFRKEKSGYHRHQYQHHWHHHPLLLLRYIKRPKHEAVLSSSSLECFTGLYD